MASVTEHLTVRLLLNLLPWRDLRDALDVENEEEEDEAAKLRPKSCLEEEAERALKLGFGIDIGELLNAIAISIAQLARTQSLWNHSELRDREG